MNSRVGTVALVIISVGLIIALLWIRRNAAQQRTKDTESISLYSNQVVATTSSLEQQRQVNTSLESDLKKQRESYDALSNSLSLVSANLEKSETSLKSSQDEIARRDTRIADLESQNQALDQRAFDLGNAITNLTAQIDDTKRKLAASEGDKAFLEKELQRLMTEKADLERQFHDLAVLRAQVAKLKEELNISRRLEWIRQGIFARADQKGAEQLMQKSSVTNRETRTPPAYDLNVEVGADGSIRVIPASTNKASGSPSTAPLPSE